MTHRVGQQRGVSRRSVLRQLAGLAVVGITGGSLVWLTHIQESQVSGRGVINHAPTPPSVAPAQYITSSGMMFGVDPQHSHANPGEHFLSPANVSQLRAYWTASTGGFIESSPAVVNGVVYVGCGDSKLYAFNASTGNTLWSATIGGSIRSSPAVVNGVVYVGCDDHKLYVFDAPTGNTFWAAATGGVSGPRRRLPTTSSILAQMTTRCTLSTRLQADPFGMPLLGISLSLRLPSPTAWSMLAQVTSSSMPSTPLRVDSFGLPLQAIASSPHQQLRPVLSMWVPMTISSMLLMPPREHFCGLPPPEGSSGLRLLWLMVSFTLVPMIIGSTRFMCLA